MSLFRRVFFFVKRKAFEYCEQLVNSKYTTVFRDRIIEQLKKRNESLTCSQAASLKTNENFGKQPRTSPLAQAFDDSAEARLSMTQRARAQSSRSHRASLTMRCRAMIALRIVGDETMERGALRIRIGLSARAARLDRA